ncbi:MAG: LytR family transcriptional regulator [Ammonifex sp.]|nr:MAG: LytR family transcriptional regulator [Ammonifex sp.]
MVDGGKAVAEKNRGFRNWVKARPVLAIGLMLCLLAAVGYGAAGFLLSTRNSPDNNPGHAIAADDGKRFNFLLLGSDARYDEERSRSDSVIFVSAETQSKRLVFLSIPRDTMVDIPGYGRDRINAAMAYGGPELSVKVVSRLIEQPIDYYVVTNYEGFIRLVDALGGITIDVDKNMYHYDPERGGRFSINLKKGLHHLDGEQALMYVRYRGDPLGDINRVDRQQKFLRAVVKEMLKPRNIVRAPLLAPKIKDCIYTNLPLKEMLVLARMAQKFEDVEMANSTLPGYFVGPYWHVDPDEAKRVAAALLKGESIKQVVKDTPAGVVVEIAEEENPPVTVVYHSYGTVAGKNYGLTVDITENPPPLIDLEIVSGNNTPSVPAGADGQPVPGDNQEELPPRTVPETLQPETPPPAGVPGGVYNPV